MSDHRSLALAPDTPVADLLRLARNAKGMSQDELGAAVGLSGMTIARIERGLRELKRGEAIALAQVTEQEPGFFVSSLGDAATLESVPLLPGAVKNREDQT